MGFCWGTLPFLDIPACSSDFCGLWVFHLGNLELLVSLCTDIPKPPSLAPLTLHATTAALIPLPSHLLQLRMLLFSNSYVCLVWQGVRLSVSAILQLTTQPHITRRHLTATAFPWEAPPSSQPADQRPRPGSSPRKCSQILQAGICLFFPLLCFVPCPWSFPVLEHPEKRSPN